MPPRQKAAEKYEKRVKIDQQVSDDFSPFVTFLRPFVAGLYVARAKSGGFCRTRCGLLA